MPDRDLGYTVFQTGDRFTEFYYTNRWYNIFRIETKEGVLRGWYCNITRPAEISADTVRAVDLELDLWVWPDGRTLVLDEDEFIDLPLEEPDRAQALAGLSELQQRAAARIGPFAKV